MTIEQALEIKQNWTSEQAKNDLEKLLLRGEQPADYVYNSKLVMDGTVQRVKNLKAEGKMFEQIGKIIGKTRQQVSQIYYKSIAEKG